MATEFRDDWESNAPVPPPGDFIVEDLEARGWNQGELARRMEVSRQTVTDIIHGRGRITPELAEALQRATRVSATFWTNMQERYDRYLERQKASRTA